MERMSSKSRKITALVAASLALFAAGCGESGASTPRPVPTGAHAEYFPDGSRVIHLPNYDNLNGISAIYQFCDGGDLVEEGVMQAIGNGGASSISRSPNHRACDDGKLTPEDFPDPNALAPTPTPSLSPSA